MRITAAFTLLFCSILLSQSTPPQAVQSGSMRRRVPLELRPEIVKQLSRFPAKVHIASISQDVEGNQFAKDLYEVFRPDHLS